MSGRGRVARKTEKADRDDSRAALAARLTQQTGKIMPGTILRTVVFALASSHFVKRATPVLCARVYMYIRGVRKPRALWHYHEPLSATTFCHCCFIPAAPSQPPATCPDFVFTAPREPRGSRPKKRMIAQDLPLKCRAKEPAYSQFRPAPPRSVPPNAPAFFRHVRGFDEHV